MAKKKILSMREHTRKAAKEVQKWPQWKKDFAADVYSVDPRIFDIKGKKK